MQTTVVALEVPMAAKPPKTKAHDTTDCIHRQVVSAPETGGQMEAATIEPRQIHGNTGLKTGLHLKAGRVQAPCSSKLSPHLSADLP